MAITLMPRSLLARSVLLIALILSASQIAWVQFYRMSSARSQSEQVASHVVGVLSTVSAALDAMPAASRVRFSETLPAQQDVRLFPATSLDVDELAVQQSPMLAAVSEQLKRSSDDRTQVLAMIEDSDHSLWVKIRVKTQAYWVVFAPTALALPPASAWVSWSLTSLALAMFGGLALLVRVNQPLQALADAASDIASGKTPPLLPEKGPTEIRTLSRGFNRMSTALAQQETNRAVLLAGVSHDLRTPLSRLRLALEMSRDDLPAASVEGMELDIEDMDRVIDQFLEFARDGATEAPDPDVDLNALVRALAERYERRGEPVTANTSDLPPLPLRTTAVQRMVTNLVENARRHASGPVEIRTHREGDNAILSVLDRGPGIPEEHLDRVMQPFMRLEDARSDTIGAGLGLAIVDRIARMHGGQARLLPREGGGLEARVELPIEAPASDSR